LAKFILILLGWNFIVENKSKFKDLSQENNFILIFPHTTYWDGAIFLLYRLAYPQIFSKSRMFLDPYYYETLPYGGTTLLNYFGFIKSVSINSKKKENTIQKTASLLKEEKDFMLWISPKGCTQKKEWRSGYFYLAKEMNVPIVTCGLDYETKQCVLQDIFKIDYNSETKEDVEEKIKLSLGKIVPLYPENSEIKIIKNYEKNNLSAISWKNLFFVIFVILSILLFIWYFRFSIGNLFRLLFTFSTFL
jgi:hypothetical protein